jgi:hypothetical protein
VDRVIGIYQGVHRERGFVVAFSGLALCGWCGWASGFHRSTASAVVTWAFSLAAVVVVDLLFWQGRRRRTPGLRLEPVREPWPRPGRGGVRRALGGVSLWLGLALVVLAWEILGIDTGSHEAHLTISALTQAYRPLNAAMLVVWVLVGLGYGAARARAPVVDDPSSLHRPVVERSPPLASVVFTHVPTAMPALLLPSSRPAGVAFWLGIVVAIVLVDLVARRSEGRMANGEELVRLITATAAANVLLVVAWTYAGYHLFAH